MIFPADCRNSGYKYFCGIILCVLICISCAFDVLEAGWVGRADSTFREAPTVISTQFDFAGYSLSLSLKVQGIQHTVSIRDSQ